MKITIIFSSYVERYKILNKTKTIYKSISCAGGLVVMLLDSYGAGNTFYLTIFTWQNAGTNTWSYNWRPVYGGRREGEILGKSGLTQKAAQGISSRGPKDSDLLGVPLRDVHGQLVASGQLGRTLGPQNHQRHVFQIWRGRALSGLLMIVD